MTAYVTGSSFRRIPADRRRKLWVYAKEIGLTTDERIELATYILRRDITSWKQLTDEQVDRMLDALEGAILVDRLLALRPVVGDHALVAEAQH